MAAFAGRALAERLHDKLAAHGLACTRLGIEAVTADGQELHRVWRHDGTLTAAAIAERVRWQLDGWLTGARRGAPARPTAGLVRLRLVPDGVLVHLGLQPGLWGDTGDERERAHRALSRVQGLLGPDAVLTPVIDGGRSADDQARLVPFGDERVPDRPAGGHTDPIPGVTNVVVLAPDAAAVLPLPAAAESPEPEPEAEPEAEAPVAAIWGESFGQEPLPIPALHDVPGERPAEGTGPLSVAYAQGEGMGRSAFPRTMPRGSARRAAPTETPVEPAKPRGRVRKPPPALPPWPGRLPKPAPAVVLPQPVGAVVLDARQQPVRVSARLELTGEPARPAHRERPADRDHRLGRAVAGGRTLVGAGRGAPPGPVPDRCRRRPGLSARAVRRHWAVEAIYD